MEIEAFLTALAERGDIGSFLLAAAAFGFAIFLRAQASGAGKKTAQQKTGDGRTEIVARLNQGDRRLARVEADVEHLPSSAEFSEVKGGFARLDERVTGIDVGLTRIGHAVGRIEEFLIQINGRTK